MKKNQDTLIEANIEVAFSRLIGSLAIMKVLESYKESHDEIKKLLDIIVNWGAKFQINRDLSFIDSKELLDIYYRLDDLKDKYFSRGNDKEINFEYFDFSKLKQFENELDIFENLNKSNANHISLQKEELQKKEQKEKEKEKLNDKLDIVPLYEDPFAKQENRNNYNNNISDDESDSDSESESISDDI